MRELIIGKNDAGQRLDKFMHKFFKSAMPTSMIYKSIRKKGIGRRTFCCCFKDCKTGSRYGVTSGGQRRACGRTCASKS